MSEPEIHPSLEKLARATWNLAVNLFWQEIETGLSTPWPSPTVDAWVLITGLRTPREVGHGL